MKLPARLALLLGPAVLVACTPAMLAAFGGVAPVMTSVLDAYAATAHAIAPAASEPDLAVLADLLRKRDECTVAASTVLMPDAGTPPDVRDKALADSEAAVTALREAVRVLTAANTIGKDGGM